MYCVKSNKITAHQLTAYLHWLSALPVSTGYPSLCSHLTEINDCVTKHQHCTRSCMLDTQQLSNATLVQLFRASRA